MTRRALLACLAVVCACDWPTQPNKGECATWRRTVLVDPASPRGAVVTIEAVLCLTPQQVRDGGWVRVGPVPR